MPTAPDRHHLVLADYNLPTLRFTPTDVLPDVVRPIWDALHVSDARQARDAARRALTEAASAPNETQALVQLGLAAAEWRTGGVEAARLHASRSIQKHPRQWAAQRLLLETMSAQQKYESAYVHLEALSASLKNTAVWDEPLPFVQQHLALAAFAWRLQRWDRVARHLRRAYGAEGAAVLPHDLLEDYFQLALYREAPADAAEAVQRLISLRSLSAIDELLQTMVQQGWTAVALDLYQETYRAHPKSELLRRRLVGLCLKEGHVEEARRLAKPGALSLAA